MAIEAKQIGLSFNRVSCLGRVSGDPVVNGDWVTFQLLTVIPELKADGSWADTICQIPCLSNNKKTINTIQQFVADERQLYIEGYVKGWDGGCGVIITNVKLGSKTIYNPEAQNGGGQVKNTSFPG